MLVASTAYLFRSIIHAAFATLNNSIIGFYRRISNQTIIVIERSYQNQLVTSFDHAFVILTKAQQHVKWYAKIKMFFLCPDLVFHPAFSAIKDFSYISDM